MTENIRINNPNVKYTDTHIKAQYCYHTSAVRRDGDTLTVSLSHTHTHTHTSITYLISNCVTCSTPPLQVTPSVSELEFRTERRVPRLGVMLVGWGGNNGTTVTAAVLANRLGLTWRTKTGEQVRWCVCLVDPTL